MARAQVPGLGRRRRVSGPLPERLAALPVAKIPAYLEAVAYTLTANPGGWICYGVLAAGCAYLLWRRRPAPRREVSLIGLVLAVSLAAILPTAWAILATYRTPGTWYRAPFLVHTVALLGAAVLLAIDAVLDMARTSVNVLGNCLATAVIARWEGVDLNTPVPVHQPAG